jgi:tRNA-splicing ligase RtcB
MCVSELKGNGVPIKLWTDYNDVESEALSQLKNISSLPWVFKHVAVMPDVHYGKGATVGSVIAMKNAVSPAAVGVDIGCGMMAAKTNLKSVDLPTNLKAIRSQIERDIPVGFESHKTEVFSKLFLHGKNKSFVKNLMTDFGSIDNKVQGLYGKALTQIGTLGGGNHFIELCLDTEDNVWLMLHSGSRNIGKELAEIHIGIAKGLIHNASLPDLDLAVFLKGTKEMENYRRDLFWAQRYAYLNRITMMELYKTALKRFIPTMGIEMEVVCHHNYVSEETHFGEDVIVTRKGAISAKTGEYGIIPGSMGAKSFIVKGKGNADSFHSASHGAGRKMSRGQAKRTFSIDDLKDQTSGVECKKDGTVLDEIPGAYKDIEKVMQDQSSLVEIVAELKQILCVKG